MHPFRKMYHNTSFSIITYLGYKMKCVSQGGEMNSQKEVLYEARRYLAHYLKEARPGTEKVGNC